MPRAIDLSTVAPERAARILKGRESKKREYAAKKEIMLARNKAWRDANPEKFAAKTKDWALRNPERKAANTRAYYDRNREAVLAKQAERYHSLNDATVRGRFSQDTPLHAWEIPQEMVPAIRQTMLIRRELRKIKKCTTTN